MLVKMTERNLYIKFLEGWSGVGFAPKGWDGRVNPGNAVYVTQGPDGGTVLVTWIDGAQRISAGPKLEKGVVYGLKIGYGVGKAYAMIDRKPIFLLPLFGKKFETIPAPTIDLPAYKGNIQIVWEAVTPRPSMMAMARA